MASVSEADAGGWLVADEAPVVTHKLAQLLHRVGPTSVYGGAQVNKRQQAAYLDAAIRAAISVLVPLAVTWLVGQLRTTRQR